MTTPTIPSRRSTPAPALEVVPMAKRDLRRVLHVDAQAYTKPWPKALFLSELSRPHDRAYLVARVSGDHVGHAGAMLVEDEAHVTTVVIDPRSHGRGLGTMLFWVLVRHLVDRGAASATLEVRIDNAPARRLYQRFGFAPAGVRAGYYAEEGGADALVMWAHDLDTAAYRRRLAAIATGFDPVPVVDPSIGPGVAATITEVMEAS